MAKLRVLVEMEIGEGDTVEFAPNFAHPYRTELAQVQRVVDATGHKLEQGPNGNPYWVEVKYWKDGKVDTQPSTRFIFRSTK